MPPTTPQSASNAKQNISIPLAIVAAGAMIALAVYFGGSRGPVSVDQEPMAVNDDVVVENVGSGDHILGNPNAKMVLIEYSDTECPFCKVFHNTMHRLVNENPSTLAWVYRHYPIEQLHAKAIKEAEATECAADQGGNATFWKYIDEVFARTNSNDTLDLAELPKIASSLGLNLETFNACLSSGKYTQRIKDDVKAAGLAGASGTPSSVLVLKESLSRDQMEDIQNLAVRLKIPISAIGFFNDNKSVFIGGAMPYEMMSGIVSIVTE